MTATTANGLTAENEDGDRLPIKMLNDRILVQHGDEEGERRSTGGILIPATAQVGKRLAWAQVVASGPNVRNMEIGDRVLFNPEDRYEVEVGGTDYIILRERDVHAVAAERLEEGSTGLYLRGAMMSVQPDFERFVACSREHRIVPVWRSLLADQVTPVAVFARCVGQNDGFLLESVDNGERWSRWSFLGRNPLASIVSRGGDVTVSGPLASEIPVLSLIHI